jgi:serine/threonine protein kinase
MLFRANRAPDHWPGAGTLEKESAGIFRPMNAPLFPDSIDEDRRREFERLWLQGKPAPLEKFLPHENDPHYLGTLEELVHIEIEMAWKQRFANKHNSPDDELATVEQPPPVESYIARFKALDSPTVVSRLLKQECLIRKQCGVPLDFKTCQARFPNLNLNRADLGPFLEAPQSEDSALPGATRNTDDPGTAPIIVPFNFGDYELLEELGRGSMGIVYRARQISIPRIVAVKVLRTHLLDKSSGDAVDRFHQEIRATGKLKHDNIVSVFEVGRIKGQHYFSMRYVRGKSLDKIVLRRPIENSDAARYLEHVARAIGFAHRNGILHRDLKPENILVDDDTDRPLVVDFGLAKIMDRPQTITSLGETLGTPSYMSPEQARDASSATERSDIYALGATLYATLSGRPPFCAARTSEILRQSIEEAPVPLRRLNPDVDRDLQTICMKCLQKDPYSRYDSASELADDLDRYLQDQKIEARPPNTLSEIFSGLRRDPRSMTVVALLTVVLLVIVTLMARSYFRSLDAQRDSEQRFQESQVAVDAVLNELLNEQKNQFAVPPQRARQLLQGLLAYYQQFIAATSDDQAWHNQVALAQFQTGRIQAGLGDFQAALVALQMAVAAQEEHLSYHPDNTQRVYQLSNSLKSMGWVLKRLGKTNDAINVYREASTLRERLAGESPKNLHYQISHAHSIAKLGTLELYRQHFEQARRHFERARKRYLEIIEDWSRNSETRGALGACYYNLAQLDHMEGNQVDYRKHLENAANQFQKLLNRPDGNLNIKFIRSMVVTCRDMGNSYLSNYQSKPAVVWYKKAEDTNILMPSDILPDSSYDAVMADVYTQWGEALRIGGRPVEAALKFRHSLKIRQGLLRQEAAISEYVRDYAVTLGQLARVQMDLNERDLAQKNLIKAKQTLIQLVEKNPGQGDFSASLEEILMLLHQLEP